MKVVAIIQARMGSSRLPGKVLLDLAGRPMLQRVFERTRLASELHDVVVATTTLADDDAVAAMCRTRGWPCFRGSAADVLDRYYQAARAHQADVVVRITADCPLLDPAIVDRAVQMFRAAQPRVHYATTDGHPRGLDVEVVRMDALEQAWREAETGPEREHVTLHIYRNPGKFTLLNVSWPDKLDHWRWTVDTMEDLTLVRFIFEHFGESHFHWRDVKALMERRPDWAALNQAVVQKPVP
jgi:spore coat polysaccharide biosynthesis protein SpsF